MSVAKSYAKALFETAQEMKQSPQEIKGFEKKLLEFHEFITSSKEIKIALLGPTTGNKEKGAVVKVFGKSLGLPQTLLDFLCLLTKKDRLHLLSEIAKDYEAVCLEEEGGIPGSLVSAELLAQEDVKTLTEAFSKKLGKKVFFHTQVDPTLLAGVKVTVNGVTYDGTLSSQLQRLRDRLVSGTSQMH